MSRRLPILLSLMLLAALGCVPVPTPIVTYMKEPPAAELTPLKVGEVVAVVPAQMQGSATPDQLAESRALVDCLRDELASALTNNPVLMSDEARDALFPWLEAGRLPVTDAAVRSMMQRPAVAAEAHAMNLRYVIAVTASSEGATSMTVGFGRKHVRMTAEILDLDAGRCRVGGTADSYGLVGLVAIPVGVVLTPPTNRSACHALRDALLQSLQPRL